MSAPMDVVAPVGGSKPLSAASPVGSPSMFTSLRESPALSQATSPPAPSRLDDTSSTAAPAKSEPRAIFPLKKKIAREVMMKASPASPRAGSASDEDEEDIDIGDDTSLPVPCPLVQQPETTLPSAATARKGSFPLLHMVAAALPIVTSARTRSSAGSAKSPSPPSELHARLSPPASLSQASQAPHVFPPTPAALPTTQPPQPPVPTPLPSMPHPGPAAAPAVAATALSPTPAVAVKAEPAAAGASDEEENIDIGDESDEHAASLPVPPFEFVPSPAKPSSRSARAHQVPAKQQPSRAAKPMAIRAPVGMAVDAGSSPQEDGSSLLSRSAPANLPTRRQLLGIVEQAEEEKWTRLLEDQGVPRKEKRTSIKRGRPMPVPSATGKPPSSPATRSSEFNTTAMAFSKLSEVSAAAALNSLAFSSPAPSMSPPAALYPAQASAKPSGLSVKLAQQ